ncbi:golgi uridine diphosphate-N- acetylglucosamine transporter [Malassezia psittaci]|uniref:Golgi uridine diphosphate-N- acetylglucosamine transporter n=1 Tax=Malassezia psittaci TaxID=1821823 RepID=A0AAF0JFC0_9BASI|nr:golgi uridine diphosphate-N- acetylglucosamine transporter [Malassezia psittaci]
MVVNMLLGWAVDNKHYSVLQIASVAMVSIGVVVATISAAQPAQTTTGSTEEYVIGVLLLSMALISSGTMGIFQEHTYAMYGREHWHEALFYSHLFALPLFLLNWQSITRQIKLANATHLQWIGTQELGVYIPSYYIVLLLNVLTQLLCVNGVNRLTSQVSSVSVSLVLVVRKAVSLVISVVWLNGSKGNTSLWGGATAVMLA